MYIRSFILLFGLLTNYFVVAQHQLPPFGPAFLQDEVASIRITLHPDSLAAVLDPQNWYNEREFPATFRYESSVLTQTVNNIGFRLRGNTSLGAGKKSFKISFNTYISGTKWQGLEKMNLNGSHNDPSMIRPKLCWDAIRESGLPGARTSFVKLYINNEYKGLYSNVEHIDEEFAKRYFDGQGETDLYKCLWPATLEYLGDNQELYKTFAGNHRIYELKITDYTDDYARLVRFIKELNQAPLAQLPCRLESVFNVDNYLRYAAIDVLTGNWDGYIYNKNNFYLYFNRQTRLIEYLPYDLDNTLGIDWLDRDWGTRNIYTWAKSDENRPLFTRLLQVPEYRERFSYYIRHYLANSLSPERIETQARKWIALIAPAAQEDIYRTVDYGFSYEDFLNSVDEARGGHVDYGILPYMQTRATSALAQADPVTVPLPALHGGWIAAGYPVTTDGKLFVMADNLAATELWWEMNTGGTGWTRMELLTDNGQGADATAGDGVYSANLPVLPETERIRYRFVVVENNTVSHTWPCEGRVLFLTRSPSPLVINELMSDNESTVADEKGGYEDWIELWNGGTEPVNLYGKFLSDDPANPEKWPLPVQVLQPGEFTLFWANSDEGFNRRHTNFGLSADGEELRLYETDQDALRLVDRIIFPALNDDISYGRQHDGSPAWVQFSQPTPNASNHTTGVNGPETESLTLYPNPGSDRLLLSRQVTQLSVTDLRGRVVIKTTNATSIDIQQLSPGIYFINADGMVRRWVKQ